MKRLPPIAGEWIDRSRPIHFTYEGQACTGYAGDTISSALWAAGLHGIARSFKYHRLRGVLSMANHDANVIVQDGQRLNVRADVTPLRAGMALRAVNTFGGVANDSACVLNLFSRFLPVGFYYKAFYGKRLAASWERMFRRLTGLGTVDFATPRLRTPKRYDFCDVLVIGAGPSGLSAALAAADAGARTVLVDENARSGGSGIYQTASDAVASAAVQLLLDRARSHPRLSLREGTLAAAYYADLWVPLVDERRMTKMRAAAVVVASGAFEQPAVFRNNDLPGVMLGSAMQRLMRRHAVAPASNVVVLAANADGWRVALDLHAAGIAVRAVVDLRPAAPVREADAASPRESVLAKGIACLDSHCIYEAHAGADGRVAAVTVAPIDANGTVDLGHAKRIACDGVALSTGWAPAANLLYQAGTRMRFDAHVQQFVPAELPPGVFACGRVNGVYRFESRLVDGQRAGAAAAAHAGFGAAIAVTVARESESPSHPWPIVAHPKGKNFVDFDEDLQLKDFGNAVQEGYDNIELLKRYSTVGMGPSQGKHSNMTALRILARLTGKSPEQVGTTTARPFFHPVPMSHLAGRGFTPVRHTPMHSRHAERGAVWMQAGAWLRPEYYAIGAAERVETIRAEAQHVRSRVGLIDVGTLGKLEARGPQAADFLERAYAGSYRSMAIGTTRYGLMLDESGVMVDEGLVARLGPEHFYFTTTTSGSATVYRELSRLNAEWRLDCTLVNLTSAYGAMNVAGPDAVKVLAQLTSLDLSSAAFPYGAVRFAGVAGVDARIVRVGFGGERDYEIHVPAAQAARVWDALMDVGATHGIRPFGVEAQRLLRLEKGHPILGQDTDGLTTPLDLDMGWALKIDKPYFVGKRSVQALQRLPRRQAGIAFRLDPAYAGTPPQECHLFIDDDEIAGRITSIAWSPHLGRTIGLGLVDPALAATGTALSIRLTDGSRVQAEVCDRPFFDPQDLRQKDDDASPPSAATAVAASAHDAVAAVNGGRP